MKLKVLKNTKDMSQKEWEEARSQYLGGSDAGTILGMNKWKSRFVLYQERCNPEYAAPDISNKDVIVWGHKLEALVAERFMEVTGKKVRKCNQLLVHPEHEFMTANVDRLVIGEDAILECKTTDSRNYDEWVDEEVPPTYIAQVQHYMAVTGAKKAYIAVLIGGNRFVWKTIDRDDEFIELLIEWESDFWYNNVLKGIPPEMDGSDSTKEYLNDEYSETNNQTIELSKRDQVLIDSIQTIKQQEKELKETRTKYENELKQNLADNVGGFSNDFQVTWKHQTSKRVDTRALKKEYPEIAKELTKESTSRVMRIKELNK